MHTEIKNIRLSILFMILVWMIFPKRIPIYILVVWHCVGFELVQVVKGSKPVSKLHMPITLRDERRRSKFTYNKLRSSMALKPEGKVYLHAISLQVNATDRELIHWRNLKLDKYTLYHRKGRLFNTPSTIPHM